MRLVDSRARSASLRTSPATTAKPRPCSPARAASMAALSASRLVWSDRSSRRARIPPISITFSPSDVVLDVIEPTRSAMRSIAPTESFTAVRPASVSASISPATVATSPADSAIWLAVAASCWIVTVVSVTAADCSPAESACCPASTRSSAALRDTDSPDSCAWPTRTRSLASVRSNEPTIADSVSSSKPSTGSLAPRSPAATFASAADISDRRSASRSRSATASAASRRRSRTPRTVSHAPIARKATPAPVSTHTHTLTPFATTGADATTTQGSMPLSRSVDSVANDRCTLPIRSVPVLEPNMSWRPKKSLSSAITGWVTPPFISASWATRLSITTSPLPGSTTRTVSPATEEPMIDVRRLSMVSENEITPTGLPPEYTAVESLTTHAPDWSAMYGLAAEDLALAERQRRSEVQLVPDVREPAGQRDASAGEPRQLVALQVREVRAVDLAGQQGRQVAQLVVDLGQRRVLVGQLRRGRAGVGDRLGERRVARQDEGDGPDALEGLRQRVLRDA